MRGWKVDDGDGGWQDDDTLTVNGKKEDLNLVNNLKMFRVLHISAGEGDSCQQRPSSRVTARSSGSLQQTALCRCLGERLEWKTAVRR